MAAIHTIQMNGKKTNRVGRIRQMDLIEYTIMFDQSHNNSVSIETNAYNGFIQYLFQQGIRVGKITKQISYEKLMDIFEFKNGEKHFGNLLVIGNPTTAKYTMDEIYAILEFIKNGGSLLIFVDEGGDISSQTNLNELSTHFGFKILPNIIYDENSYVSKMVWPLIRSFARHPITSDVESIVYASGCSFQLLKRNEFDEFLDVSLKPIATSEKTSKMKIYDQNQRHWCEMYANRAILALAGQFFDGRFFCLGTPSILSSLNNQYGFNAKDNLQFIENIILWLLGHHHAALKPSIFRDKVQIELRLAKDIFRWANDPSIVKEYGDFSALVTYALKELRKNLKEEK